MSAIDELLDAVFGGMRPPFYAEFEGWLRDSRRFRAFATEYSAKIRTKLRNVRDDGGLLDVRAELETAARLMREERFAIEYEKFAASKQRGPDFSVMFKTHTPFNVEVRRVRSSELDEYDYDARIGKVMAVLCDKVGQMPPSVVNFLWLITEREGAREDLLRAAISLRGLAERKSEEYFRRHGFESAAAFLKHFQRLSGIVLRHGGQTTVWLNSLARHAPPPDLVKVLRHVAE